MKFKHAVAKQGTYDLSHRIFYERRKFCRTYPLIRHIQLSFSERSPAARKIKIIQNCLCKLFIRFYSNSNAYLLYTVRPYQLSKRLLLAWKMQSPPSFRMSGCSRSRRLSVVVRQNRWIFPGSSIYCTVYLHRQNALKCPGVRCAPFFYRYRNAKRKINGNN